MALRKSFVATDNFNFEVNLENCYCKVFEIKGDKTSLNIVVYVFNDDATKFLMEKRYVFSPNLSGQNFIAQAYEHLKILPEFAGATNC
jgi:hypothetical protein